MKNSKNNRSASTTRRTRRTPTPRIQRRRWVILGAALLLALMGGWMAWGIMRGNAAPRATIVADVPTPAAFTDATFMILGEPGADGGLPMVNNERSLRPGSDLRIRYEMTRGEYTPALRADTTDAELNAGIKIYPFIPGTWRRWGGDTLVFTPKQPFPADQRFSVDISPKLLNRDLRAPRHVTFATPKLTATVESLDTYADPARPRSMIAVGVISFDYPIDARNFDNRVTVKLGNHKIDFSTRFDAWDRTVLITSAPIAVGDTPQNLRMIIDPVMAATGNAQTPRITADTIVDAADNLFKVTAVTSQIVDANDGTPQQLILVSTTAAAARDVNWSDYLDAWLLPLGRDTDDRHRWATDEVTDNILNQSQKLSLTPVDLTAPAGVYQYAFAYDVSDKNPRYLYVRLKPGMPSQIGFDMRTGMDKVMAVTYPAQTVQIAGSGALLTLGGERRLTIVGRGGAPRAYINVAKVKSSEINHLISQTYNIFTDMSFKSWAFGPYDMSVVFKKTVSFADPSPKRVNYASVDLGAYLDRTPGDKTGIFIIQTGTSSNQADYNDHRLILLTDLGIIRKVNADGGSAVFVSRLATGAAAADVTVDVLGRNGNPVWSGKTDASGRVDIPVLAWAEYKNAREPVAIVARRDNDVSFIPYNGAWAQQVEYSKFDVDGTYGATAPMNAFVFSDRGVYRPGEEMIIGTIVKEKNFKSLAGVPVQIEIDDPRGRTIFDKTISLNADGMFDVRHTFAPTAGTGEYGVRVYSLNDRKRHQDLLGSTTVQVAEFVPDTLEINAHIDDATDTGWQNWDAVRGTVTLRNLYGTPAANARITAQVTLTPAQFSFPQYAAYKFTSNFIDGTGLGRASAGAVRVMTWDLPDMTTDDNGVASLAPHPMTQPVSGTYNMAIHLRGFEGASGNSVRTTVTTRVSDARHLVGYRASGDLSFVAMGAARSLHVVAVGPDGMATAANDLRLRIMRRDSLTSLIKDNNDYYKYQTVTRDRVVGDTALAIGADGETIKLDTATPGTYVAQILGTDDRVLAHVDYFVAGGPNATLTVDSNADLRIKLNRTDYAPGDTVDVAITAPYAGTGLITIERDRVYAARWFRTTASASTQRITIPADFEGTGYINVSFVRDINSPDVFTSPYTFAVAPFAVQNPRRQMTVTLDAPDRVPGGPMTVDVKTSQDAHVMLFAVDAGILQVARYQMPRPLAHFFQKAALQVTTYQILSLVLPEYNVLREYAKTGGGDYDAGTAAAALINPFARRVTRPMAFYSGMIQTQAKTPQRVSVPIPDSFNGTVRIYAVATNATAMGAADTRTVVQAPVVLTPTAPMAVAPGDKFDIGVMVANMMPDSDAGATVRLGIRTDDALRTTGDTPLMLNVPPMRDAWGSFGITAGDNPGATHVQIRADLFGEQDNDAAIATATRDVSLSVRPITPQTTILTTGDVTGPRTTISKFRADLYPAGATRTLSLSRGAAGLIMPLGRYLQDYDYNCTEQMASRIIGWMASADIPMMGVTHQAAEQKISTLVSTLKNRQNDDGSFALWAGGATDRNHITDADAVWLTAYVADTLMTARDANFNVPDTMIARAVDYLRSAAGTTPQDADTARANAYAIYVATRAGFVTTGYIGTWTSYADQNIKNWSSDVMGARIAAAYKIMHQDDAADRLMAQYKWAATDNDAPATMMRNPVADNATYAALRRQYFQAPTPKMDDMAVAYINRGAYDAHTAAALIRGLMGGDAARRLPAVRVMADDTPITADANGTFVLPEATTKIIIECDACDDGDALRYAIVQTGFERRVTPVFHGIDIQRAYYDAAGRRITSAPVGADITVRITVRATGATSTADHVAIVDLLPGGFVADAAGLTGPHTAADVREDRVVIFAPVTRSGAEITYHAVATTPGTFQVPPITATDMYAPTIRATTRPGTFQVNNATSK
ncbi:alpha-2-macroglobulin family protein [bacterium]|nr:alpha-2-macroglobulin family protein [bacterium]